MRAPFELGCSPSPASITPALISSSLNLPMSASSCSVGITPASDSFDALTSTMKRIVISLVLRSEPVALLMRRTTNSEIDKVQQFPKHLANWELTTETRRPRRTEIFAKRLGELRACHISL